MLMVVQTGFAFNGLSFPPFPLVLATPGAAMEIGPVVLVYLPRTWIRLRREMKDAWVCNACVFMRISACPGDSRTFLPFKTMCWEIPRIRSML